jgi:excisionase family DNA binding protein
MTVSPAAGKPGDTRPPVRPELIDLEAFAALLDISTRHARRLVDAGKCPAPVRLGKCVRFSRAAVERWLADGCPRVRTVRAGGVA